MKGPEPGIPQPLAARDGEAPFTEAWQAQVIALAARLVEAGHIAAADWSEALGAALREAEAAGADDSQETYYRAALTALERLGAAGGLVAGADLEARVSAWRRAYHKTPHGEPVRLESGSH